jgi:hypothetical protein
MRLVDLLAGELAVGRELADVEVDRAVDLVGEAVLEQRSVSSIISGTWSVAFGITSAGRMLRRRSSSSQAAV